MVSEVSGAGNPAAVNMVGRCYMDGNGVEQDQEKAFQYFQKASEAGDESAMFNLADCYFNGLGTEQSEEQAVRGIRKPPKRTFPLPSTCWEPVIILERVFRRMKNWHCTGFEKLLNRTMPGHSTHWAHFSSGMRIAEKTMPKQSVGWNVLQNWAILVLR